ncbi:hypothetical protein [Aliiglaciecola lipolytica]|uniref:Uncharacterized protein n=1 Tax=Aliiglaciecola lipolytica E3 TaxID=1127673 RepID=K6XUY3_9ALTE|nr:hypothetical protein [Aliiglaciecola lipolytica]GAC15481.1 hypothetical protein GLIP_2860 [Aliiglaciecola lipolytica E3]
MTAELITLRNTLCESSRNEMQQQLAYQQSKEKEQRDKQYDNLVNRLDKLRALAKTKNGDNNLKRKVQTSFAF